MQFWILFKWVDGKKHYLIGELRPITPVFLDWRKDAILFSEEEQARDWINILQSFGIEGVEMELK